MNDQFVFACSTADIARGEARNLVVAGVEMTIFHTAQGFIAHSGYCKHNAFKLEHCEISGDIVRCPRHGWRYRISSGEGLAPNRTSLDNFPVEIRGDEVWINPEAEQETDHFDTSSYQW